MSDGRASFVEMTAAGVRWQFRPELRELLFGQNGLRLSSWLKDGTARVVKHGPHRTVYRVMLAGCSFFLKHYRLHDARAWLRELVRPSKARMEFDRALAVAARGVPTATPLAVGECVARGPADSFLITQALDEVIPLSDFIERTLPTWTPKRRARMRVRLARAAAEMVARLHDAGILHNDFHPGNLLLHYDAADLPSLYLIDLHAVTLGGPLGWPASRANLVMLNRWFTMRVGRADRLRFWHAYSSARLHVPTGHGRYTLDLLGRDLERRTWLSNLAFWRSRDRRCLENNRHYRRVRSRGVIGHAVPDLDAETLAPFLADPDALFHLPGVKLLKNSRSSTVAEFSVVINGEPRAVVYKRFRVTSWRDPWTSLFRRSAALRSWVFGHGLRERCLPTARPLAVFHRRVNGLACEGYLLTEKISDAVDLRRYVNDLATVPAAERRVRVRRLVDRVAVLVRELHSRQLSQRDLKAANLLVGVGPRQATGTRHSVPNTQDSATPQPQSLETAINVWLIDLVGMRRCRRLSRRRRVQNLARLHTSFCHDPQFTRTDKLRFLRTYLQWGLFGRHSCKRWWHEIAVATNAKIARNQRSGRPLA